MALARPRCEVGVICLNVIWVEIFGAGRVRPIWVRVSIINYGLGS